MGGLKNSENFLTYNDLKYEDRLLFTHAGLDRYINAATTLLGKRLEPVFPHALERPLFNEVNYATINAFISELLTLIGTYSNARFGISPQKQHAFFMKPHERGTFPVHLYISRWHHKKALLLKNKKNQRIYSERSDTMTAYSPELFKGLSGGHKIKFGSNKLNETETRAVGVLYMIGLAWKTLADSTSKISGNHLDATTLTMVSSACVDIFSLLDDSALMQSHTAGGKKGNKRFRFFNALEIIQHLVGKEPDLETNILVKRVIQRIETEGLESKQIPSSSWIAQQVRNIKAQKRLTSK